VISQQLLEVEQPISLTEISVSDSTRQTPAENCISFDPIAKQADVHWHETS
jgi:hypothetical protein